MPGAVTAAAGLAVTALGSTTARVQWLCRIKPAFPALRCRQRGPFCTEKCRLGHLRRAVIPPAAVPRARPGSGRHDRHVLAVRQIQQQQQNQSL